MNFVKASFDEVYNKHSRRNAPIALASESKMGSDFIQYFWGTGYHLYTQLSLEMKYTAPQNIADARKSLEIIQRYTDLAYGCATKISGRLLEVQGERLHFYFDRNNDVPMLQDIIRFCHVLMSAVYENKKYLGDEAFAGFKIAFDHGPAVILESGVGSAMSFVSLWQQTFLLMIFFAQTIKKFVGAITHLIENYKIAKKVSGNQKKTKTAHRTFPVGSSQF